MWLCNIQGILLLICLSQVSTWPRSHSNNDQEYFQRELIHMLANKFHLFSSNSETGEEQQYDVDPDDHVDVARWNQLNGEEIKNMPVTDDYSNELDAMKWLRWYSRVSLRYHQASAHLSWNYQTNLTEENQRALTAQQLLASPFHRLAAPIGKKFNEYMKDSQNADLKLIFGRLSQGSPSDDDASLKKVSELHAQLESIYSEAKVCELDDKTQCYALSPYLERLMQVEKDYDRLTSAWKGWHDSCGNAIRPVYLSYIDLLMKDAQKENGKTLADRWAEEYEMGNSTEFVAILDDILKEIMPFYEQLHGFVRGRLCEKYPNRFDCNGPIPAHLLGNMWAQQWHDRLDDLLPYPDAPLVNITHMLLKKHYTIDKMYKTAETFFTSINLYPMTPKFWARSMFTKPTDRNVVCHPSASNMDYHDDYRVKVCTIINDDYFYTIHHEMGHIEYYMSYAKEQPFVYQDGANSGFHEAIGDTIGMYAISPTHLVRLGFVDEEKINQHYEINYLMRIALQKAAFIPFAYVMDKYRFALFRNQIDREHELNSMWWNLRVKYGGIMAATERSDAVNFDPGAKYHIPSNVPYSRYLIAHILQFQFYRAMCRLQGHHDRIHMCDIYGNKHVGDRFKQMLSMGSSQPWSRVLESLTGERKLEPQAMLDFFKPLHQWLKMENLARGYPVGWS